LFLQKQKIDDEGVMILSGHSPALMKFILSGEMTDVRSRSWALTPRGQRREKINKITPTLINTHTPTVALHKILNDSWLDDLRVALNAMSADTFLCA
jgi:hypothetical protein